MRLGKAAGILRLARRMAGTAEGLSFDDIKEEFEVNRRTAERMRDAVRDLFPDMEEHFDGRVKRFLIPGGLDSFLQVPTVEELADLALAAETAQQEGLTLRADNLRSLAGKVEARIKPGIRTRYAADVEALALAERIAMRPGPRPGSDPVELRRLRSALLAMRQVSFHYRSAVGEGGERRIMDPCGLLFGSIYYLVARQVGGASAVLWRLDRISEVRVLETPSSLPEGFDLAQFSERSFGVFQEPQEAVVLKVSPAAATRAADHHFHPSQTLEPQPDGSLIVRLYAGGLLELCWHLFTWRGELEILQPERLKAMMAEELALAGRSLGEREGPTVSA